MTTFKIDRRDHAFVAFEQFKLHELCDLEPFKDYGREEFESVLETAQQFAVEVLSGVNIDADRIGAKFVDGRVIVPESFHAAWKTWSEGGWIAADRGTDLGGMGLPFSLQTLIHELVIGSAPSFSFFPGLTVSAGHLLESFASKEIVESIVPRMYAGEWTGTMCLTEPQAGTSVGDITTSATPIEGTDEFLIKGNKIFITCGDHDLTDNVIHLVLARVPGDPAGTKGISLFMVPTTRINDDGTLGDHNDVKVTSIEHKMGIHGSPTCAMSFGDNDDCRGKLIGQQSAGMSYMFQMMNEARIYTGIQGSGAANAAFQGALAYAKERVQGTKTSAGKNSPQVNIIEHPDVRRNLMFMKAYAEGLRALLTEAGFYADMSDFHPDEGERNKYRDLVDLLTPVFKAYATDMGFKATELGIQIHGGYGYIAEYGMEQLMRDVKIGSLYEGTNGVQALDLLGRKMRLRDGAMFLTWIQETTKFVEANKDHPELADVFVAVGKARDQVGAVAMGFAQVAKDDFDVALLGATPFLEMLGHAEVGRLLADQARIAHDQLQQILAEHKPEDTGAFLNDHADARFYDGKIKVAKFFAANVLPQVTALAKSIQTHDRSALDIVF